MAASFSRHAEFGRRVSQRDIAERAGVSISTVSRVLSNKPSTISEELIRHVKTVAEELLRHNNMFGNGAPLQHISLFIGARSMPNTSAVDPFYGDILLGIEGECKRQGFQVSFTTIEPGQENSQFIMEKIKQSRIDGVIFLAVDNREILVEVVEQGLPAVLVNAKHTGLSIDTFLPDYREGATLAVQHLLQKGHKRILHVADLRRWTLRARYEAYRATLEEAGVFAPELVLQTSPGKEEEIIRQFFKGNRPDFTAIFCVNDIIALQTIKILRENSLRVPEDFSIIGFDDLPMVNLIDPPLTTVRVERQQLGARAVRGLIDRVALPEIPIETVELACRLVERKSVRSI
jgi:DNA-binding LacI/PurR family transcriptional regulator